MAKQKDAQQQARRGKPSGPGKQEMVGFRPRVVVKFHDYVELPYKDGVEDSFEELRIGPWERLAEEFPGITFRRLLTALEPKEILELADRATELDRTYQPPNLLTYFVVDCPSAVDPEALAKALSSWPKVQTAYLDQPAEDPVVDPRTIRGGLTRAIWMQRQTASVPRSYGPELAGWESRAQMVQANA